MTQSVWSLVSDLDNVAGRCDSAWRDLAGKHVFITGGTGFIGCWLLEALRYANVKLGANIKATILTRSVSAFRQKAPHLAGHDFFDFIEGSVTDFDLPGAGYSHFIHAATDASAHLNETDPCRMYSTIIDGTRRVLDIAVKREVGRVLFLSSGAVYGQQPWEMTHVPESWLGGPNCVDPRATYGEAKRAAEMLCAIYHKQHGVEVAIARIFALIGPYLNLDIHFAAGNFIRDAMAGRPVVVNGNGLPCRSYLYAGDLTVHLLNMLTRAPSCRPYNVGSDESVSIGELAQMIADTLGNGECRILGQADVGWNPGRYVPDTQLIETELGLKKTVSLREAILRTALWNGWKESQE